MSQRINDSTTLYILNLAFCDFLFCLVPAPMFALHLIYRGWPFGKTMCAAAAILRWTITFVDYLSLSLIAFSRFFMLSHPRIGKVVFTGRLAQLPLAGTWILGIIAISPNLFGVSTQWDTTQKSVRDDDVLHPSLHDSEFRRLWVRLPGWPLQDRNHKSDFSSLSVHFVSSAHFRHA